MQESSLKDWVQFDENDVRKLGEGQSRSSQDSVSSTDQACFHAGKKGSDTDTENVDSDKSEAAKTEFLKTEPKDDTKQLKVAVEVSVETEAHSESMGSSSTDAVSGAIIDATQVEVNLDKKHKTVTISESPNLNSSYPKATSSEPVHPTTTTTAVKSIMKHTNNRRQLSGSTNTSRIIVQPGLTITTITILYLVNSVKAKETIQKYMCRSCLCKVHFFTLNF